MDFTTINADMAMSKKPFLLLIIIVLARLGLIYFFKADVHFYLSPRNFNGRGLLTIPTLWDFLLPLPVIALLYPQKAFARFNLRNLKKASPFLLVILVPFATGLILIRYREELFFFTDFKLHVLSRWLLFISTFWAIHLFADHLTIKNKAVKRIILFIFMFFLAFLQDTPGTSGAMYILFSLINSIGVSAALLALASRKSYKTYPAETLLLAGLAGFFIIPFMINARSASYFTVFLPMLAMYLTAFLLYSSYTVRTKSLLIALPILTALFLNFILPPLLSPAAVRELTESSIPQNMSGEKVGTVSVKYADKKLRDISLKLARVIDAANKISMREFGISPQVDQLTILGIAPGGFHGKFPREIVGNIISEQYLKSCNDSLLLNNPDLPADFPDPVNAILHEYSHLYGAIPYYRWMPGAEEEGWATLSATILSSLLHKKYGDSLWQPAYNYASQAGKITRLNLEKRAVVWSHPNEFGGFRLWYELGKYLGPKDLYKIRWNYTYRDLHGTVLLESDPQKARRLAIIFGLENFKRFGTYPAVRFDRLYSPEDYRPLWELAGVDRELLSKLYKMMCNRMIDPSVPIPNN